MTVHSHASFTLPTRDRLTQPSVGGRDTAAGFGIHGGGEGAVGLKTVGADDRWVGSSRAREENAWSRWGLLMVMSDGVPVATAHRPNQRSP